MLFNKVLTYNYSALLHTKKRSCCIDLSCENFASFVLIRDNKGESFNKGENTIQEIEIELKTMLTKEEFERLNELLPFPKIAIQQINHYFETENFSLKEKQSALRIRQIDNEYVLTLKEPHKLGILETHDILTEGMFHDWVEGRRFEGSNVVKRLNSLNIKLNDLQYYGSLTTERKTFIQDQVSYMLDYSYYHGQSDYELEIEASTKAEATLAMKEILEQFHIVEKKAIPKIARFFLSKNNSKRKND